MKVYLKKKKKVECEKQLKLRSQYWWAGDLVQMVKHLPSKGEDLSSNSSTTKKEKG
jgi:hypothetical protein